MIVNYLNFAEAIDHHKTMLVEDGLMVDTGHWQGVPTEGRPDLQTRELMNVNFTVPLIDPTQPIIPISNDAMLAQLQAYIEPNLPWADEHFAERVSGVPSNPGEAYKTWPWWRGQVGTTQRDGKFDHTYQERYWPKEAGDPENRDNIWPREGIRYHYGDLDDLVSLLFDYPGTRQAYLPIFYPEDTGNVFRGRIPCTLGYQFLLRGDVLHMWYFIRSCDFVRHFRDDLYLSARLLLWVIRELVNRELRAANPQFWVDINPGSFTFVCPSLHIHRGDEHLVS
jgi:hypothetical protein